MSRRQGRVAGRALFHVALLGVCLCAGAAAADSLQSPVHRQLLQGESCPQWGSAGQTVTAVGRAAPTTVFTELQTAEMDAVSTFLFSRRELNLTNLEGVQLNPSYMRMNVIHGMWYEMPPKADVVRHLDQRGPLPPRRARVVLIMNAVTPPVVREVLVPLPSPRSYSFAAIHGLPDGRTSLPMVYRPQGPMDSIGLYTALAGVTAGLNSFFRQAFNGYQYAPNCTSKCLGDNFGSYQYLGKGAERGIYVWFIALDAQQANDGHYLHPIPFQMLVTGTGDALDTWSVRRVWFNFRGFSSVDELLRAWAPANSPLRTFRWQTAQGADALYSGFKKRPGPQRGAGQPVGPIAYEPYGRRFTISQGNRVEWLGWGLSVGLLPTSGPRIMDVRFKGERIAYEVSMQEALADYGAGDLAQANTLYLDSHWGLGASVRELLHGVDCPLNAAYMDITTWYKGNEVPVPHKNAICVFESDSNVPVLRHYSYTNKFYGAVKGWALTIRMVAEVYNYDYIIDTHLYVDGTMETKVQTSGYVQANAMGPNYPARFGYPLTFGVGGTIHNHHLAWKVDLDIGGQTNSVNIHEVKMGQINTGVPGGRAWAPYYDAKIAATENEAAIITNHGTPKLPVVINEASKNKWGSPRGYKVQVNRPVWELMPEGGYKKSLGFARYTFAATAHKPLETASSSIYNQGMLANPAMQFESFINGEPLRNTDVVAWVSAGLFHIPAAEDAPVTPTTGNHIGFSLIPFNWGNENLATDMADMIHVTKATAPREVKVQAAASRCGPSWTQVPFLQEGFEEV